MNQGNLSKKRSLLSELTEEQLQYIIERLNSKPGYIGENGNWYIWDNLQKAYVDSGVTAKGEPGKDGTDGHTPVKGTDYFTPEDVAGLNILSAANIVEIIKANAQRAINEDTSLPPSVQCMLEYVDSYCSVYGGDINALRDELYNYYVSKDELYNYYVSKDELNENVKYTDCYINHDMRIENLEIGIDHVEAIAKGRATGYVFDTVEDMDIWLADNNNVANLNLGDNLYIRATDVPDYWWDGTQAQQLETQKVDLTDYVKKNDYANGTTAGVVRIYSNYGVSIADGRLRVQPATKDDLGYIGDESASAGVKERLSYSPIVGNTLHYAVEVCTNQDSEAELTEAQLRLPVSTQFLKDYIEREFLGGEW